MSSPTPRRAPWRRRWRGAATLGALSALRGLVAAGRVAGGLTARESHDVLLALEELLANVLAHGLDPGAPGEVAVELVAGARRLRAVFADTGKAFDPTRLPPPDLGAALAERPIGGLGVHLVRELFERVEHRRAGRWNRLVLSRRRAAPGGRPRGKQTASKGGSVRAAAELSCQGKGQR